MGTTLEQTAQKIANADDRQRRLAVFEPKVVKEIVKKAGAGPIVNQLRTIALSTVVTEDSDIKDVLRKLKVANNCYTFIELIPAHAPESIGRYVNDIHSTHRGADAVWAVAEQISHDQRTSFSKWAHARLSQGEMNTVYLGQLINDSASRKRNAPIYDAVATFIRNTGIETAIHVHAMVLKVSHELHLIPTDGKKLGLDTITKCHKIEHLMQSSFNNKEIKTNIELRGGMVAQRDRFSSYWHLMNRLSHVLEHHNYMSIREKRRSATAIGQYAKEVIFSDKAGLRDLNLIVSDSGIGAIEREIY
ncbi:MAG TPA: hypothetical protein VMV00_00760 [Candidatus Baltobacteraceae bacterium]|nr:hypothetical protein [Candidatus Baltobacteraceae bacterium]